MNTRATIIIADMLSDATKRRDAALELVTVAEGTLVKHRAALTTLQQEVNELEADLALLKRGRLSIVKESA